MDHFWLRCKKCLSGTYKCNVVCIIMTILFCTNALHLGKYLFPWGYKSTSTIFCSQVLFPIYGDFIKEHHPWAWPKHADLNISIFHFCSFPTTMLQIHKSTMSLVILWGWNRGDMWSTQRPESNVKNCWWNSIIKRCFECHIITMFLNIACIIQNNEITIWNVKYIHITLWNRKLMEKYIPQHCVGHYDIVIHSWMVWTVKFRLLFNMYIWTMWNLALGRLHTITVNRTGLGCTLFWC